MPTLGRRLSPERLLPPPLATPVPGATQDRADVSHALPLHRAPGKFRSSVKEPNADARPAFRTADNHRVWRPADQSFGLEPSAQLLSASTSATKMESRVLPGSLHRRAACCAWRFRETDCAHCPARRIHTFRDQPAMTVRDSAGKG